MKSRILKSFLGIGLLLTGSSCSNFLDQPILGQSLDTPAYYNDVDNANMAVIACYDALQYDDDMSTYQWMLHPMMLGKAVEEPEKIFIYKR